MVEMAKKNHQILEIFFFFLWPHLHHVEISRLGVESELQLLAYITATLDLSHICDLCCSLWLYKLHVGQGQGSNLHPHRDSVRILTY